jgi:regulator of protease activity HflC (stomatin/prohibitin superfamily)
MRPTPFQVAAQELLTFDGLTVRVSLGGEYRVPDPALFVITSSDAFAAFYLEAGHAFRTAVGELTADAFPA